MIIALYILTGFCALFCLFSILSLFWKKNRGNAYINIGTFALLTVINYYNLQHELAVQRTYDRMFPEFKEWEAPERFIDSVKIPEEYEYTQDWLTDSLIRGEQRLFFMDRLEDSRWIFYRADSVARWTEYTVFDAEWECTEVYDFENKTIYCVKHRLKEGYPFPDQYEFGEKR